jgi:ribonuclease P protein component
LVKKSDYDHVFTQAKKMVTPDFVILYRENLKGEARLGLAISKKIIAKAHDRNRIKRAVRETFRKRTLPAVDIIVLARHGLRTIEKSQVTSKLSSVWDKLCEK